MVFSIDWQTAILIGFFTGIGNAAAEWFKVRYIHKGLDRVDAARKGIINNKDELGREKDSIL
jgi:hypothetical protein